MNTYTAIIPLHWWKAYRLSQELPTKKITVQAKDLREARRIIAYICKQGKCPHGIIVELSQR
jgi:hypothetical protein